MGHRIELSFCIPTFNRVQSVKKLVLDILSTKDQDIEVVVLDNGSTDDTLSVLNAINDKRLSVYCNGENKGSLFNIVNVVTKGRGRFVIFTTDKDHIDPTRINDFRLFLLQNIDLACGYCELNSVSEREPDIIEHGYKAIKEIAYQGLHPTGYFFNQSYLKSIEIVKRFSDHNYVGLFPFEFVLAELCLINNGAIYHKPLFTTETTAMAAKQKSFSIDGRVKGAYFTPESRLKQAINYTKHLHTLNISSHEKELLTADIFVRGLFSATIVYKSILMNENLCTHHYMDTRNVSTKELVGTALKYYTNFINKIIQARGWNVNEKIKFNALVIICFFNKCFYKLKKSLIIKITGLRKEHQNEVIEIK